MKFEEIPAEIQRVWKLYAVAKANYEMMDESKKSVLAVEASEFQWSEAFKDRKARCSDKFREYLKWVQAARQKELEYKYEIDWLQALFEYYRSCNSLKKKEMSNF